MCNKIKISFQLNNELVLAEVESKTRLLDMLRDYFGLTSVKEGCSEGQCGACTVILNGKAVASCIIFASSVDGSSITTIEGLEKCGELDPLQQAFIEKGAVQCGFCTPGMILSAKALLMKNPHPSVDEIKRAISGNLCRCTGYKKIIEAIKFVVDNNVEGK